MNMSSELRSVSPSVNGVVTSSVFVFSSLGALTLRVKIEIFCLLPVPIFAGSWPLDGPEAISSFHHFGYSREISEKNSPVTVKFFQTLWKCVRILDEVDPSQRCTTSAGNGTPEQDRDVLGYGFHLFDKPLHPFLGELIMFFSDSDRFAAFRSRRFTPD